MMIKTPKLQDCMAQPYYKILTFWTKSLISIEKESQKELSTPKDQPLTVFSKLLTIYLNIQKLKYYKKQELKLQYSVDFQPQVVKKDLLIPKEIQEDLPLNSILNKEIGIQLVTTLQSFSLETHKNSQILFTHKKETQKPI